jgi:uncharacterized protein YcfL
MTCMKLYPQLKPCLVALAALALTSCISPTEIRTAESHAEIIFAVSLLSHEFYFEHHRWPKDFKELQQYTNAAISACLNSTNFAVVSLMPQDNSTLTVTYTLAAPAEGQGTITLAKPTITQAEPK